MTTKQERKRIKEILRTYHPNLSCRWLKKLNHQEIHDLWLALIGMSDDEELIQF